jgi:hypothetical protein
MRFILTLVGLVLVGMIAVWLFGHLLTVAFYLLVGALVVGGAVYVVGRVRRSLSSGHYRRITR